MYRRAKIRYRPILGPEKASCDLLTLGHIGHCWYFAHGGVCIVVELNDGLELVRATVSRPAGDQEMPDLDTSCPSDVYWTEYAKAANIAHEIDHDQDMRV